MTPFPFMQFFVGDWTSDPKLSMCSAATRGIWMDALCAMHVNSRAGELSGTPDQLARVCRCLPAEMSTAIADLQSTNAADVTIRNGVVTLVCRRMKQEESKRKSVLERVKRHRNGGVTPEKPDCNADVTDTRVSESEDRRQKIEELPEAKASSSAAEPSDPVQHERVRDDFHRLCPSLPRIRDLTDPRKKAIRARWKNANGQALARFEELFVAAEQSDFLSGRNGEWAGCSFDWLMSPTNAQKVLEGNYSNERKKPNGNSTHRPAQSKPLVPGSSW